MKKSKIKKILLQELEEIRLKKENAEIKINNVSIDCEIKDHIVYGLEDVKQSGNILITVDFSKNKDTTNFQIYEGLMSEFRKLLL